MIELDEKWIMYITNEINCKRIIKSRILNNKINLKKNFKLRI